MAIGLIGAAQVAERDALRLTSAAQAEADADKTRAMALRVRAKIEAESMRMMNEAHNMLLLKARMAALRMQLVEKAEGIICESVKPMERIEDIETLHVDGLGGAGGGGDGDVIVTRDYRFADAVQRACGGADVVIDGLGDAARDENLVALARRGHWISLGQASGPLAALPPDALVAKSLRFSRPVVFGCVADNAQLAVRAQRVWAALADGTPKPPVFERHPLAAAAQAHARLESRATSGAPILIA